MSAAGADEAAPLRLLWVATKSPWPPRDGGRLLQWETLRALAALPEAPEVDLVAPAPREEIAAATAALAPFCHAHLVPARPRPLPLAALVARARRLPITAVRHDLPPLALRAVAVASERAAQVVHAEQVQAMPQALAAAGGARPVLLRAQNVESDLWRGAIVSAAAARWRAAEAERLGAWEGAMVTRAERTLALTVEDAARLSDLAGGAPVEVLPVPFASELPAGPPLPGSPAVTLLVGSGWAPNREGAARFLRETWPRVHARLPGAVLHLFGDAGAAEGPGTVRHPTPEDAAIAFPAGGLLVVPLALASGVRMKILEAWARGVPVVATPAAAAGLGATGGRELLVAPEGEPLAAAILELAADAALRDRLARGARELLRRRHAPAQVARALRAHYAALAAARG